MPWYSSTSSSFSEFDPSQFFVLDEATEWFSSDSFELEEPNDFVLPTHIRCFAHTLNLVASSDSSNALKNEHYKKAFGTAMDKCKKTWNLLSKSSQASETAHEYLGVHLKHPTKTRWNSLYDSLISLLAVEAKLGK